MADIRNRSRPRARQRRARGRRPLPLRAITVVVGIVLGFVIDPILFAVVGFAIVDFVIAAMFSSGRIGPLAARRKAVASGDAGGDRRGRSELQPIRARGLNAKRRPSGAPFRQS